MDVKRSMWVGCTVSLTAWLSWRWYRGKLPSKDRSVDRRLRVVITGASRGFGKALAREYVRCGDDVILAGRQYAKLQEVAKEFETLKVHSDQKLLIQQVDVQNFAEMEVLRVFTEEHFGKVDIWINNAGISQQEKSRLVDTPSETIDRIIRTNVLGTLHGTRNASRIIMTQGHPGHIFNVDGAGSRGMATPNFATYGFSKAGMPQLLSSLSKKIKILISKFICSARAWY